MTFSDINQILEPVIDATHTRRGHVARCLQGTREGVIAEIVRHIEENDDHPICWLKGPAGYGKSAISQEVAEIYAAKERLAASFFFLQGAGNRSVIAGLISTIANQLTVSVPATKPFIQSVIEAEPHITSQSLSYQFQRLVIGPIMATCNIVPTSQEPSTIAHGTPSGYTQHPPVQANPVTMIMVIDGLDECDDKNSIGQFVEIIIDTFRRNPRLPLRILIASRIEEHIRRKLETAAACLVVHSLSLQDFSAKSDIRKFFRSSFTAIYEENRPVMRNVPLPWPSNSDLTSLVEKSDGSFLFAVTLMDVIRNENALPQDNLHTALTAGAGLDTLYTRVLLHARRNDNFERVIGTVMLLRKPLAITAIAELLWVRAADIVQTLLGIQSILMIPGDDDQPIQLFHTSLRDYLTSRLRSNNFYIDPPTRHFSIATDCLSIIAVPPKEGIFYDGGQKYASLNWCYHLHEALIGDHIIGILAEGSLMQRLTDFAFQSLDFWVNTMLLDGYNKTLNVLDSMLRSLEVSDLHVWLWNSKSTYYLVAITRLRTRFTKGLGRY